VDVVVRTHGKPVEDLAAGDFSLFDQGRPQRIAAFSVRRASAAGPVQRLAEGEVSNRQDRRGEEPVAPTVILLDNLDSDSADMAEVRRQLLLYLDNAPAPERIAIYSLNKTLRVVRDFTDDQEQLRETVRRWHSEPSTDANAPSLIEDLPVTGDALTDGMIRAAAKEMTDAANLNRAETAAWALQVIARHLSGLPGRKKLIWAGVSFSAVTMDQRSRVGKTQIEIRDYSRFIEKSVHALNEAQVAVYPIDPRDPYHGGLTAPGIETMNLFAGGTGGRAFYNLSDLAGAFREALEDSEVTYVLGFYPDAARLDGKYHALRVHVARKNVEVRHRRGYVADDNRAPDAAEQQHSLRTALEEPLDATGIGLAARLIPSLAVPGAHEVVLRIHTQDLEMKTEETGGGARVWSALVAISTFLPEHSKPNGTLNNIKLTFTEKRLEEVTRDGYLIRVFVDDRGRAGPVRVAVQDRSSGRTGSLTLPL
jgi:VWFA-related protein